MRRRARLEIEVTYDAERAAHTIATPESVSPDFAQWPDAYCGKAGTGYPNRPRARLFLTHSLTANRRPPRPEDATKPLSFD
jgi:hypothetical protein